MATEPITPDNPFQGGGAEKNIDIQRGMLNDLIANQGQAGKQLYARQAPESQAMLAGQLSSAGEVPAARQAVYDAFTRDARAAEQQHANTIQRQGQINQAFMDQTQAAVPMYSKNADLASQAMRQQYDLRMADQRRSAASAPLTGAALGKQKAEEKQGYWGAVDPTGKNPDNPFVKGDAQDYTVAAASQDGGPKPVKTMTAAALSLNLPPWQKLTEFDSGLEPDARRFQVMIDDAARQVGKNTVPFHDMAAKVLDLLYTDTTLKTDPSHFRLLYDTLMAANAARWGVSDPTAWDYNPGDHASLVENFRLTAAQAAGGNWRAAAAPPEQPPKPKHKAGPSYPDWWLKGWTMGVGG